MDYLSHCRRRWCAYIKTFELYIFPWAKITEKQTIPFLSHLKCISKLKSSTHGLKKQWENPPFRFATVYIHFFFFATKSSLTIVLALANGCFVFFLTFWNGSSWQLKHSNSVSLPWCIIKPEKRGTHTMAWCFRKERKPKIFWWECRRCCDYLLSLCIEYKTKEGRPSSYNIITLFSFTCRIIDV